MLYYIWKNYSYFNKTISFAWIVIFAGAVANVGERIALGYVRDFVYISLWKWTGVYNLADFYIIVGILVLLVSSNYKKGSGVKY